MTEPTDDQVSQAEKPAEQVELSKDTLADLDATDEAGEVRGGAERVATACTDRGTGCIYD